MMHMLPSRCFVDSNDASFVILLHQTRKQIYYRGISTLIQFVYTIRNNHLFIFILSNHLIHSYSHHYLSFAFITPTCPNPRLSPTPSNPNNSINFSASSNLSPSNRALKKSVSPPLSSEGTRGSHLRLVSLGRLPQPRLLPAVPDQVSRCGQGQKTRPAGLETQVHRVPRHQPTAPSEGEKTYQCHHPAHNLNIEYLPGTTTT